MNYIVKNINGIQTTDINNLVKIAEYITKLSENEKKIVDHDHDKYITTQEFNKLTTENSTARLKQKKNNLVTKVDAADFAEETDFDDELRHLHEKVTSNKIKHAEAEKKLINIS